MGSYYASQVFRLTLKGWKIRTLYFQTCIKKICVTNEGNMYALDVGL